MQDVAVRAGVSAKTVSRVFNDDPHVLPATRERVTAAVREVGYVPNGLARTFRNGRSSSLGVAVPDVVDPFFAAVVRAVEDVASAAGLTTVVSSIGEDPTRERPVLESLLRTQPVGLVLAPVAAEHHWLQPWHQHTPIVFLDRAPTDLDAVCFADDDHEGARLATEHLLDHGHTRVAFLADDLHPASSQRRRDGWRSALRTAGIAPDPADEALTAGDESATRAAVQRLWDRPDPPTAVFSSNARVTMSLVRVLGSRATAAAPAMVGFGDFPMADQLSPSVSVVQQQPSALGRLAATRVLDPSWPEELPGEGTVLPVRLVRRASCGCPSR